MTFSLAKFIKRSRVPQGVGGAPDASSGAEDYSESIREIFDVQRPLVFMHIPKTAGSTLMSELRRALRPKISVNGYDRYLFGTFSQFSTIDAAIRQNIYLSSDAMPRDADFVAGHIALSTLVSVFNTGQLLTLLREPFCRLLSLWLYWRQYDDQLLAAWGEWMDRVRLAHQDFSTFLDARIIAPQIDNIFVRMLLWPHVLIPEDDFIDPADDPQLVAEATNKLSQFAFLDVVENSALFDRLGAWLGRPVANTRINDTETMPVPLRRPLHRQLTQSVYEQLESRSRLDIQLWKHVARQSMPNADINKLLERTRLDHVARYAGMMA